MKGKIGTPTQCFGAPVRAFNSVLQGMAIRYVSNRPVVAPPRRHQRSISDEDAAEIRWIMESSRPWGTVKRTAELYGTTPAVIKAIARMSTYCDLEPREPAASIKEVLGLAPLAQPKEFV